MMSYPEFKKFMFNEFYYIYHANPENNDKLPKTRKEAVVKIIKEFKEAATGKAIISDADYNRL